jgi:hypothetical protein
MQQLCKNPSCRQLFEISDADLQCLDQLSPMITGRKETIPPPTLCPDCRLQRRFSFRNERFLHRRKCDLTGKEVISFYAPDSPVVAYDHHAWWGDGWNALDYGRDIDFSRPIFAQIAELFAVVPRMSMMISHCENCDFAPYSVKCKNCYMTVSCLESEDLFHCMQTNYSMDSIDCAYSVRCELCAECLGCSDLKTSIDCQYCENSTDLLLCNDCIGCSSCIGCKNLRGKKFHILNEPVSEETFESTKHALRSRQLLEVMRWKATTFFLSHPFRATHKRSCENVTGDDLIESRNVYACFNGGKFEDCRYIVINAHGGTKDSCDINYCPGAELAYESLSPVNSHSCIGVMYCWDCYDSHYSSECFFSKHLFGCAGLKRKEYCILNKQYTEGEYAELAPKIIERMRKDQEWSEFLPSTISPFAYNESIAQEYVPLTQEAVRNNGWQWQEHAEEAPKVDKIIPATKLPDAIDDIPDDIVNWAIECAATKRPFRIIRKELDLLKRIGLPMHHLHPDERYKRRMALRNPRKLWNRECAKCQQSIATSYAPERPEIVYCEECYLKEVY